MYFWNIESLKSDIIKGKLTDRAVVPYVVVYVGLNSVVMEFAGYFPYEEPNQWDYILSAVAIMTTILGTVFTYYANGGNTGKNFTAKYFAILFVMAIRFSVLLLLIMGILSAYWFYALSDFETISVTWLEVALLSAWYVALYLRMANTNLRRR